MRPGTETGDWPGPDASGAADDPRLLELAKAYQAELDAGRRPDRAAYLARHPDLAAVLPAYLDGLDLLRRGAADLSGPRPHRLDTGLSKGDRLGGFDIVREVGRGGMGVVYEAVQPGLNRRVALKVLPAGFAADRKRLQRFTIEAQAAAAVAHPHIVPVYAVGEDRGVHFYVMKLVDGSPLDVLTGPGAADAVLDPAGPPSAAGLLALARADRRRYHRELCRVGATVGRALDHAHQCGVVHRDVKPANLLLGRDGHVWVTDFGLAQFADAASVTRTGATVGTLRYMSPEQAAGDRRRLDHRTDVYSLAATLYELLTGRPAFPGDEAPVLLRQVTTEDPPAPSAADPAAVPDLDTVLLKALQKDPRDRYPTAAEFADDLLRVADGEPVLARRPSAWDRAKRWAGRHPAAVAAVLVSLLVIGAASAITTALVAAGQRETEKAYRAERDRADEAERRFRQSKELSDLVLRISEEEIGSDSPFQGPRRRLLLAALENYKALYADGHDPAVKADLDRVLGKVELLLAEQATARAGEALYLLRDPQVRKELDLSPGQAGRVEAVLGSGPGRFDPRRKAPDPAARAEVLGLLSAAQRGRLRQLFVQDRGTLAFHEPEVVEALGLTADQRQQIRAVQAEAFAGFGPPPGMFGGPPGRGGGPPGKGPGGPEGKGGQHRGPRFDPEAAAKVLERVLDVLTPEQREAWRALVGKPFTWGEERRPPGERGVSARFGHEAPSRGGCLSDGAGSDTIRS